MNNIRWALGYSGNSKFTEASDGVIEKKVLKTDVIYNVVILNSDDIKRKMHFIQDDSNDFSNYKTFKKVTLKKKFLETAINEIIEIEKIKIHWEMYAQNEVKEKLSHKYIKKEKKSIIAEYKVVLGEVLKKYLKTNTYFQNDKPPTVLGGYIGKDAFPYDIHQSGNELLSKNFFDILEVFLRMSQRDDFESQAKEIKEKIHPLIKKIYELEEKKASTVIYQQYISKATISGYLRSVHHLNADSVTKPFISLVEEKYCDGFLARMNDQASSIEIFNLNDQKCVARFLKIFDVD
ncbi:hypothetical protein [Pectobacterium carotovorum]|uniref:hypothetical protein n=1 Tax=Pectobacterium carotovorum TaxID=554 RepID=UPI003873B60D